jgi:biopolymer transport protein TolR
MMGEINVVPYIDVMLVLLIIFMVTAPLLTQGITVDLPRAAAEPLDPEMLKDSNPLILSVDREGRLFLNIGEDPDRALDEATVAARTAAALQRTPELPVLVKADTRISHGRVVEAMAILQQAGARRLGIITDPPERERRN